MGSSMAPVYVLFRIDNVVQRTQMTAVGNSGSLRWTEDSQSRFDVKPGALPVLSFFVMELRRTLPVCLTRGELPLSEVLREKESSRTISLHPMGQLELEMTYYPIVPIVPRRGPKEPVAIEKKGDTNAGRLISSVDQVFVDEKTEERNRLRKFARSVKRRYRSSKSHYPAAQRSRSVRNLELLQAQVDTERALPATGVDAEPDTPDSVQPTLFSRSSAELNPNDRTPSLEELDLSTLPFSAGSIGTKEPEKLGVLRVKYEEERLDNLKYTSYPPEVYAFLDRLEKGNASPSDFVIEGGVSDYKGDGTWGRGCLRDSIPASEPPCLPPKIPVGMEGPEYFVLEKKSYMEYFKGIYSL